MSGFGNYIMYKSCIKKTQLQQLTRLTLELILACARHVWQLSSEGSLACHTYCGKGHPFIMVISDDPWHSHLMPSILAMELSLSVLTTWVCRGWDSNAPTWQGERSNPLLHRGGPLELLNWRWIYNKNNLCD